MTSDSAQLYQRLQAFELDDPSHPFGFTHHLMKSHGWSMAYAQRAIEEYKKFAFLTVVAAHQVVPSDAVDQVWHAHVLLTQSYWDSFCPLVLQQPLHHHPARGGKAERAEFHRLYGQTIASYRRFFGTPPGDIWSSPDRRFGVELQMRRINVAEHWVIPKRWPPVAVSRSLMSLVIPVCLGLAGCIDLRQHSNPNQFSNAYFLLVLMGVFLAIKLWRYCLRLPRAQGENPRLDCYEIAYLLGGASRAAELAIVQLVDQGYLCPNVQNRSLGVAKKLPHSAAYLQQQVMGQVQKTPQLKDLQPRIQNRALFLADRLRQEHLLLGGWAAKLSSSFGYFFLVNVLGGFGLALIEVLVSAFGIPTVLTPIFLRPEVGSILEFFCLVWGGIGLLCLCCWIPSDRTHWGDQIRTEIQKNYDAYDLSQAFAVKGVAMLSGGALDDLKQIFQKIAAEEAASGGCGC
jgi:uncharacterized protein (TIGR04222 family)